MHRIRRKHRQDLHKLPVLNKFRRPYFLSSTLNTEYFIFIKQNNKINIFFKLNSLSILKENIHLKFYKEICSNRLIMAAAENMDFEPTS